MAAKLATRAEAVQALGLASPRALEKLIERGAPGPKPGKRGGRRYDIVAIRRWRKMREARLQPAVALSVERGKLARVQCELATLRLREARGELIKAADAERVQTAIAAAVRVQLLAVPRRAVLEGLPREHEPLIRRLIRDALRELAERRTLAALVREPHEEDAA